MRFCHGIEIEDDVKNGGGRKEGKFGLSSGIFDWSEYVNLVFFFHYLKLNRERISCFRVHLQIKHRGVCKNNVPRSSMKILSPKKKNFLTWPAG